MSKRVTLELEFQPKSIEFFSDYFLIIYKSKGGSFAPKVPYIDIFEKTGRPLNRIDLQSLLASHDLEFKSVK